MSERIIDIPRTESVLHELLLVHKWFVKLTVDVRMRRIAGGEWHADTERLLIETGSKQEDIW